MEIFICNCSVWCRRWRVFTSMSNDADVSVHHDDRINFLAAGVQQTTPLQFSFHSAAFFSVPPPLYLSLCLFFPLLVIRRRSVATDHTCMLHARCVMFMCARWTVVHLFGKTSHLILFIMGFPEMRQVRFHHHPFKLNAKLFRIFSFQNFHLKQQFIARASATMMRYARIPI